MSTARDDFLRVTQVVDWNQPEVRALAASLGRAPNGPKIVAQRCFEWVRDEVRHTGDYCLDPITCSASEVLRERSGYCYAKSHLLAALLRANGIPAGFVYQRLALDPNGTSFCLHGLNGVWLDEVGWYRIDARGNRDALRSDFTPPVEVLPFACTIPGEQLFPGILPDPFQGVVDALRTRRTRTELEENFPDAEDLIVGAT